MIKIFFLIPLVYSSFNNCTWIDQSGNKYDYSLIDRKGAWHVEDTQNGMGMFNMIYVFNFCKIDLNCHFIPVAVYEGLEVMGNLTDNCDVVGLEQTRTINHIPDYPDSYGIQITFDDESQCIEKVSENKNAVSNKPRKAVFNIVCSDSSDSNFILTQSYGCTTILEIHHPAGCINCKQFQYALIEGQSASFSRYIILILLMYATVGLSFNYLVRKQRGIDAIPNKDIWVEIVQLIGLGIKYCVHLIKNRNYNGYTIV